MQSIMENLCRCFGSTPVSADIHEALSDPSQRRPTSAATASTPDMKKRMRSLKLQNTEWDALFNDSCNRSSNRSPPSDRKRKRPSDIFRSKKSPSKQVNPLSRFLSNHPALANSLCFATPVRDENEDDNSVVSDTNTLNTAQDTVTSTLYYEQTKLAGLKQKNPPMPLFNHYQVNQDIRQIVKTGSHSSHKMKEWLQAPALTPVSSGSTNESPSQPSSSNKYSYD